VLLGYFSVLSFVDLLYWGRRCCDLFGEAIMVCGLKLVIFSCFLCFVALWCGVGGLGFLDGGPFYPNSDFCFY